VHADESKAAPPQFHRVRTLLCVFVPWCEKSFCIPSTCINIASITLDIDPDNPLAAEIRHEMAHAYFAACKKMVAALDALKEYDQQTSPSTNPTHTRRRSELLSTAAERVHFVIIQRDAMKLPMHDGFFEDYDIPSEVRTGINPLISKKKIDE
jgi:hypothetical protein